jgi:N6-adenosine-specific RNA methylase IME4
MIYTPDNWPTGTYRSILTDPAWPFTTYSDKGKDRSPEKHYDCMTIGDIAGLPVGDLADKDCVLFMWAPGTWIANGVAQWIMEWGWGFKPKTFGFVWTKEKPSGAEHVGLGYWSRDNPEFCLLGTRGRPKRLSAAVRKWMHSAVREHSRKPDEIYDRVEALSEGPYVELFARTQREGWASWGNETDKFTPQATLL